MNAILGKIIPAITTVFKYHKKKILFLIGSTLLCFVLFFPYSDLSDFASAQISRATRNQVNVQFDDIGFGLMPQLGVRMNNVNMDFAMGSSKFPNLKLDSLGVAPNLLKTIFISMAGKAKLGEAMTMISKVQANGLFEGDINLYLSGSNKLGSEAKAVELEIDVNDLNLSELTKYTKSAMKTNLKAKGFAKLQSKIVFDPVFKEQPDGTYELNIKNLTIPASTQQIPFNGVPMALSLPGLKLDKVKLRGKISDRRFEIIEGKIGDVKNDLWGEITGDIILNLRPGGRLDPGGYNFVLDLNLKEAMISQLGAMMAIFDGMLGKFKNSTTTGVRYKVRIKGNKIGLGARPPQFSNP